MKQLPERTRGKIILLHSPPPKAMLTLATKLALAGPLSVLDTGNQFDAYQIARLIRRQTVELNTVLNRLHVARAFTCYQVITLFEQSLNEAQPYMVLDLLSTFYDENVSHQESHRLLQIVISHLKQLRQHVPVVISVNPPRQKKRLSLIHTLANLADRELIWQTPPPAVPLKLF